MPGETSQANQVAHQISSTLHVETFAHHGAVGTMSSAKSIIAVNVGQLSDGSPKSSHLVLVVWKGVKRGPKSRMPTWPFGFLVPAPCPFGLIENRYINIHLSSLHGVLLSLDLVARRVYTCKEMSREVPSNIHRFRSDVNPSHYALLNGDAQAHVIWTRQVANACNARIDPLLLGN